MTADFTVDEMRAIHRRNRTDEAICCMCGVSCKERGIQVMGATSRWAQATSVLFCCWEHVKTYSAFLAEEEADR